MTSASCRGTDIIVSPTKPLLFAIMLAKTRRLSDDPAIPAVWVQQDVRRQFCRTWVPHSFFRRPPGVRPTFYGGQMTPVPQRHSTGNLPRSLHDTNSYVWVNGIDVRLAVVPMRFTVPQSSTSAAGHAAEDANSNTGGSRQDRTPQGGSGGWPCTCTARSRLIR